MSNDLVDQLPVIWVPEDALWYTEVGKNVCGWEPREPAHQLGAGELVLLKPAK